MNDEIRSITPEQWDAIRHNADALDDNKADNAPAVIETPQDTGAVTLNAVDPVNSLPAPNWQDLTDSQKIDILHRKIDLIGQNVDWIGKTFQGVINMVGSISPMDLFKMMRGGK